MPKAYITCGQCGSSVPYNFTTPEVNCNGVMVRICLDCYRGNKRKLCKCQSCGRQLSDVNIDNSIKL